MNERDYFVRVFWSEEDRCYIGEAPELSGCSGLGDTPEEALKEAHRSISGWLEVARKNHVPIPRPATRESAGRLNLRLPTDVIRKIKMAAAEHGLSINQYLMKKLLSTG